jgi:hypothetical protein
MLLLGFPLTFPLMAEYVVMSGNGHVRGPWRYLKATRSRARYSGPPLSPVHRSCSRSTSLRRIRSRHRSHERSIRQGQAHHRATDRFRSPSLPIAALIHSDDGDRLPPWKQKKQQSPWATSAGLRAFRKAGPGSHRPGLEYPPYDDQNMGPSSTSLYTFPGNETAIPRFHYRTSRTSLAIINCHRVKHPIPSTLHQLRHDHIFSQRSPSGFQLQVS